MQMIRFAMKDLQAWKNKKNRKPLIIEEGEVGRQNMSDERI